VEIVDYSLFIMDDLISLFCFHERFSLVYKLAYIIVNDSSYSF